MTGTINLGDEWEITADETVDDLVIRHKPTANSFALGADGTFTPLPELAITSVDTVPDKAARLSVSAEEGDIVIQTDVSKTFVLTTNDPTVDSNWVEIQIDVLNTIDGQQITPSQVGTSTNRTDVVADTVDTNNLTGVSAGGDRQGCRVFLSADQGISQNTRTKIQFDSESYDSGNNFDKSTHNWTCPKDGLYAVNTQVRFVGGAADQDRRVLIGTATNSLPDNEGLQKIQTSSDSNDRLSALTINKYAQGDTIAGYARNSDSTDVLDSGSPSIHSFLEVAFLGGL
jgi:hypothetical protein